MSNVAHLWSHTGREVFELGQHVSQLHFGFTVQQDAEQSVRGTRVRNHLEMKIINPPHHEE